MRIDSIEAGWLIREGKGYIGPVEGAARTIRFTNIDGRSVQWHFPTPKLARQFMGMVLRIPTHTPRPATLEA